MVLIDIEAIDSPWEYNILLGRSYMYAVKTITLSMFHTMISPHNGKVITVDQLTPYEFHPNVNLDNFLSLIRAQP